MDQATSRSNHINHSKVNCLFWGGDPVATRQSLNITGFSFQQNSNKTYPKYQISQRTGFPYTNQISTKGHTPSSKYVAQSLKDGVSTNQPSNASQIPSNEVGWKFKRFTKKELQQQQQNTEWWFLKMFMFIFYIHFWELFIPNFELIYFLFKSGWFSLKPPMLVSQLSFNIKWFPLLFPQTTQQKITYKLYESFPFTVSWQVLLYCGSSHNLRNGPSFAGKWVMDPPANNHYKMAGHVAPISRDFSGNQPLKSVVVHFIL